MYRGRREPLFADAVIRPKSGLPDFPEADSAAQQTSREGRASAS